MMPTHFSRDGTPIRRPLTRTNPCSRRSRPCEPFIDSRRNPDAPNVLAESAHGVWRLGIVRDHTGHVHLGAVISNGGPPVYLDLLAAVGAATPEQLDLDELRILVRGDEIDQLRHLAECCVEDERLRSRLIELANASRSALASGAWAL